MSYETKNGSGTKVVRSQIWAVVLYDYEDPNHDYIYNWIQRTYEYVSIMHVQANENEPKTHRHVMFKTSTAYTVNGIVRLMGGLVEHVEPVESRDGYLQYMCHRTPACWVEFKKGDTSKREYPITDMKGSTRWIQTIEQNAHFVQLTELMLHVKQGYSVFEYMQTLPSSEAEKVCDFLHSNQFVFQMVGDQRRVDMARRPYADHYKPSFTDISDGDISNSFILKEGV